MRLNKIILFCLLLSPIGIMSQTYNDSLYFCRDYIHEEIGNTDIFGLTDTSTNVTIMVKLSKPIGIVSVRTVLYKREADGSYKQVFDTDWDVLPDWDYIFFSDIPVKEAGYYKASLTTDAYKEIVSGFMEVIRVNN